MSYSAMFLFLFAAIAMFLMNQSGVLNVVQIVLLSAAIIAIYVFYFQDTSTLHNSVDAATETKIIDPSSLQKSRTNSTNFAYSIWVYVDDWKYKYGDGKVIFGRMKDPSEDPVAASQTVSPLVYLDSVTNDLIVKLSTHTTVNGVAGSTIHTCRVPKLPLQTWTNIIVSVFNRSLDVYIDGKLVKTCVLEGVANIDTSANVYLTPRGGFSGWRARFKYWADGINPQKAWGEYTDGYGSNIQKMFGTYGLKVALVQNGKESSSVTI